MSFEQPKFEKNLGRNPEKLESEIAKLKGFLERQSLEFQKEGIPVDKDMKVNMDLFEGVYKKEEIEQDKNLVKGFREKWFGKLANKVESGGDDLEMLKTAIFQKNFGMDFIIVRSSSYDDIEANTDNIILERRTGNIVCALDEVGDIKGEIFEDTREKVLKRNTKGCGAYLKYGFTPKEKSGFKLGKITNLPIFYLALPENSIREGIRNFKPSMEESSDTEKKLFKYFIETMNFQAENLLTRQSLNLELKKHLGNFKNSIGKLSAEKRGKAKLTKK